MRFDRLILVAGWLATAAAVATAVFATGQTMRGEGLGAHLLLALVSAMGVLLPHLWIVIYLAHLRWTTTRAGEEWGDHGELMRCLPVALGATVIVVAAMASGASAYSSGGRGWHQELAWIALAVQPLALWWEGRVLGAHARRLEVASEGGAA